MTGITEVIGLKHLNHEAYNVSRMTTFGQNLQRLRKAAGLKGYELAGAAAVPRTTVSRWENNKTGLPET
ncbi:MAG: helix-turn-helix transcriptional regulator, partial [SAR324 cluster bacterium]|nr:helix-turn-helix transcriptional regulator [SAR324 cluster bacterium]